MDKERLKIDFLGKTFENPYILAATPSTDEFDMLVDAFRAGWAGAILKTTAVDSQEVNLKYPMMHFIKDSAGRLMTLGNIDLISEYPLSRIEKVVKKLKDKFPEKIIIPSIMGQDKKEWQILTKTLVKAGADMIECSFSCPQGNIGEDPGKTLAQSAKATEIATSWVKEAAKSVPVLIKLTPQVTDIAEIAAAVKRGGGDGVVVSNSVLGILGIDIETGRPIPTVNGYGGVCGITGKSVKPMTLKNIAQVAQAVKIPILGVGGLSTYVDAIEMMMAGAGTVQVGTAAMMHGFRIIDSLLDGMDRYLERKKYKTVSKIVGKALPYIVSHDAMPYKEEDAPAAFIDQDKCIQCNRCYIACNDGGHRAIYREDGELFVDEELCFGCGFCPGVCPVDAISLEKRKIPRKRTDLFREPPSAKAKSAIKNKEVKPEIADVEATKKEDPKKKGEAKKKKPEQTEKTVTPKKTTAKKAAPKKQTPKPVAKKTTPKKSAAKKTAPKKKATKPVAKKTTPKKPAAKKATPKKKAPKPVTKKAAIKKPAVKKAAPKKQAPKKVVKKAATKKPAVKKAAPKKQTPKKVVKKTTPKKTAAKKVVKKAKPKEEKK
ncbi:NAD-dependent dihydropyrimidine dehydrogenase subunit PreA [bacterium]|nr:NAD-dependent dihydropyrimidine dehydrogenase subunit PreA [bacterium]